MKVALALLTIAAILVPCSLHGQDKKNPDKKPVPRVAVALPLGAAPGATTRLTLRGMHLDGTTEVQVADGNGKVKILAKGKANVPDKNPDQVGDTQVEVELTLDSKLPDGVVMLTLVTPHGETKPHGILVNSFLELVKEKEPNDGFRQAQQIKFPVVIEGAIDRPRDVDVFSFAGKKGQKIVFEILAARYGSPLDSILTLHDSAGQQIDLNDDQKDTTDSRLETTLPSDGIYYLSVMDAHDAGSSIHVYRLVAR